MMKDGLLVSLHITRPSFLASLSFDDLAVKVEAPGDMAGLEEEISALKGHFKLGVKRLLPETLYKKLLQAEDKPRRILYKYSINYRDTSRGSRFIPGPRYEEWAAENEEACAAFWELARQIEDNYPAICAEVLADYRKIAEFAWRQHFKSRLAELTQPSQPQPQKGSGPAPAPAAANTEKAATASTQVKAKALKALLAEKDGFIEAYLAKIKRSFPRVETIKAQFSYEFSVTSLALPLEIASNVAAAAEIRRAEQFKKAQLEAELKRLKAEEEKAEAEVWAKRQVEAEKARLEKQKETKKLEVELARLERAQRLQEQYLAQVKEQKQAMLDQFWDNLLLEINQTIAEGAKAALDGLDNNEGKLPGRSRQGLITMMEKLSAFKEYLDDETLAEKIEQLHAVLPPAQAPVVGGRRVQLDTAPLRRVLEGMRHEAQMVLLDLESTHLRSTENLMVLAPNANEGDNSDTTALGANRRANLRDDRAELPVEFTLTGGRGRRSDF